MKHLLCVRELQVLSRTRLLVDQISFDLSPGEFLAVVGESGSGKSVTAMACCGLLAHELTARGSVTIDGVELIGLPQTQWRRLRRGGVAAIFQDPMSSLNPLMRVCVQIAESLDGQLKLTPEKTHLVRSLLQEVGLDATDRILNAYPYELSGGQQQRVVIALALASNPRVLIADEPTTALDAATQAQVIDLLQTLREQRGLAVLMVTHDLSIVRSVADTIAVFHEGRCVEQGDSTLILTAPGHSYTQSLVRASTQTIQRSTKAGSRQEASAAGDRIIVRDLSFSYPKASVKALDDITLTVHSGDCLGIVGASGSGKSTLAKMLVGALVPAMGQIEVCGLSSGDRWHCRDANLAFARKCQYVFQDTTGSLNPSHTVGQTLCDALRLAGHHEPFWHLAEKLVREVELGIDVLQALPDNLSGGQRQRVVIARALAMNPEVLVCDEPVSALDAHLQKQVINLLMHLQSVRAMTLVFIGHDLHLMGQFCDRLVVMDAGRIVEQGQSRHVLENPRSSALRELIGHTSSHGSVPVLSPSGVLSAALVA